MQWHSLTCQQDSYRVGKKNTITWEIFTVVGLEFEINYLRSASREWKWYDILFLPSFPNNLFIANLHSDLKECAILICLKDDYWIAWTLYIISTYIIYRHVIHLFTTQLVSSPRMDEQMSLNNSTNFSHCYVCQSKLMFVLLTIKRLARRSFTKNEI